VGQEGACWKNATIVDIDGEIAGSAVGYTMPINANLKANPNSILQPIYALFMQTAGSWIIDALAVYSHWRNKGVAEKLLANQFEKAAGKNVYLVAADDNIAALGLYLKHGFKEFAREACIPYSPTSNTKNWLLLQHNNA
jgi:ribosomal protein S18 acetylase RimI-like enzyme